MQTHWLVTFTVLALACGGTRSNSQSAADQVSVGGRSGAPSTVPDAQWPDGNTGGVPTTTSTPPPASTAVPGTPGSVTSGLDDLRRRDQGIAFVSADRGMDGTVVLASLLGTRVTNESTESWSPREATVTERQQFLPGTGGTFGSGGSIGFGGNVGSGGLGLGGAVGTGGAIGVGGALGNGGARWQVTATAARVGK